jgi:hypothetical protein
MTIWRVKIRNMPLSQSSPVSFRVHYLQVFILLSEQHNTQILYTDSYSILLNVSAVYFSHHTAGILVHNMELKWIKLNIKDLYSCVLRKVNKHLFDKAQRDDVTYDYTAFKQCLRLVPLDNHYNSQNKMLKHSVTLSTPQKSLANSSFPIITSSNPIRLLTFTVVIGFMYLLSYLCTYGTSVFGTKRLLFPWTSTVMVSELILHFPHYHRNDAFLGALAKSRRGTIRFILYFVDRASRYNSC